MAELMTSQGDLQIRAKEREQLFGFLAGVFLELPDAKFVTDMQEVGLIEKLDDEEFVAAQALALGRDRARLLRAVGPEKIKLPYESQFCSQPLVELFGELQDAYSSLGVHLAPEAGQPFDYVGIELAYLELLAGSEHEARAADDDELADRRLREQRSFYRQHLAPWLNGYGSYFEERAQTDFYKTVGLMIAQMRPFGDEASVPGASHGE